MRGGVGATWLLDYSKRMAARHQRGVPIENGMQTSLHDYSCWYA